MSKNEIFWDQITSVDHAIILPNGELLGNSFDVGARVRGPLLGDERVVVDFSTGKKLIKSIIDGEHGLDHKLWAHPTQMRAAPDDNSDIIVRGSRFSSRLRHDMVYTYEEVDADPSIWVRELVRNELVRFRATLLEGLHQAGVGIEDLELYVSAEKPNYRALHDYTRALFRYTHGLPRSTSYGCQNPLHGHLSYVALRLAGADTETLERAVLDDIFAHFGIVQAAYAHTLDNIYSQVPSLYFYNLGTTERASNSDETALVRFDTLGRGHVNLEVDLAGIHPAADLGVTRWVACDDYSTIENLVHLFAHVATQSLNEAGYSGRFDLVVSEGLNKGACYSASL